MYEMDNRTIFDALDQICKDANLYPYVKQFKSKKNGREHSFLSMPGGWGPTMLIW